MYIQLTWNLVQSFIPIKLLQNVQKDLSIVRIFLTSTLLLWYWPIFLKIKIFQNFCPNLREMLFLGVYDDKSNVFQDLESNYIDSNCLYLSKKYWLFKESLSLFSVISFGKCRFGRSHPNMIFKIFLTHVFLLSIKSDF